MPVCYWGIFDEQVSYFALLHCGHQCSLRNAYLCHPDSFTRNNSLLLWPRVMRTGLIRKLCGLKWACIFSASGKQHTHSGWSDFNLHYDGCLQYCWSYHYKGDQLSGESYLRCKPHCHCLDNRYHSNNNSGKDRQQIQIIVIKQMAAIGIGNWLLNPDNWQFDLLWNN